MQNGLFKNKIYFARYSKKKIFALVLFIKNILFFLIQLHLL